MGRPAKKRTKALISSVAAIAELFAFNLFQSINIYRRECIAVIGSHALRRTLNRSPEREFNLYKY